MTPRNSDALLVDALRAGRVDAFERLYADYHAPIYNLCARIVGDREEAKDLTQDVFIAAFRDLPPAGQKPLKLRPGSTASRRTPASTTCARASASTVAAIPPSLTRYRLGSTASSKPRPWPSSRPALGQLNDRYRTALVLKDLQGLPPEEIAEVMEVSRPTADVLVHRARAPSRSPSPSSPARMPPPPPRSASCSCPSACQRRCRRCRRSPSTSRPCTRLSSRPSPRRPAPPAPALLTKIGAALTTKAASAPPPRPSSSAAAVAVKEVRTEATRCLRQLRHRPLHAASR